MSTHRTLKESITKLIDLDSLKVLHFGTVQSVDTDAATCTVQPLNGDAEFSGVQLRASELGGSNGTTGHIITPTVGSVVMYGVLSANDGLAVVLMYSEIDKVTVNSSEIQLGTGNYTPAVRFDELKTLLENILDEINLITVNTPAGVSNVPNNVAQFTTIKSTLDNLQSTTTTLE